MPVTVVSPHRMNSFPLTAHLLPEVGDNSSARRWHKVCESGRMGPLMPAPVFYELIRRHSRSNPSFCDEGNCAATVKMW